jgi:dihydrofolate synthase/folylpolyglutamate synthase
MTADRKLIYESLDYGSALRRILSLADYERMAGVTSPVSKFDLTRMVELTERLGHPERCAPVVHVAGTKGKGSVAAMIASICSAAGLRTGLFTSPHLHTFRERLRVNGIPVSEVRFARLVAQIWPHVEAMEAENADEKPSTFEALTAMAFELFRAERVDVQVLEVGLGGRLDSTNVADGEVAIITSLSLDHTAILGNSLEQIAAEKAGIIKSGARVVLAPQVSEADAVVAEVCRRQGARLWRLGTEVIWQAGSADLAGQQVRVQTPSGASSLWVPLLGVHQQENVAVAVAAVASLESKKADISAEAVERGIRSVDWPGRFQVLATRPYVVVDGAHNPYSMAWLRQTAQEAIAPRSTTVVFGCSLDKDLSGMVAELMPLAHRVVVCASRHPRAVPPDQLRLAFDQAGLTVEMADQVPDALELAQAGGDDLVLVTGSLFVVAEALEAWFGIVPERYPELEPEGPVAPETMVPKM